MNLLLAAVVSLVVESPGVSTNAEWRAVSDAIQVKHVRKGYEVQGCLEEVAERILKKTKPKYVTFVLTPQECKFKKILKLHRLMRTIKDDPYENAVWGVVTGPDVASAMRVAKAEKPDLSRILSTTGVNESLYTDVVTISDANPPGGVVRKAKGGEVVREQVEGDMTHIFAAAWKELEPGVIVTSSHASERNLEMPFSRGNIVVKDGELWTQPNARLIDYATGHAKEGAAVGVERLAKSVKGRIWIAPGNCLIANNLDNNSMVMAALGYGHCDQFMGYMVTTWYGAVGWGCFGKWQGGGKTLGETYLESVNETIAKAVAICPNQAEFKPSAKTAKAFERKFYEQLNEFVREKAKFAKDFNDKKVQQELVGSLWDRDTTVLWGDPALETALPLRAGSGTAEK